MDQASLSVLGITHRPACAGAKGRLLDKVALYTAC